MKKREIEMINEALRFKTSKNQNDVMLVKYIITSEAHDAIDANGQKVGTTPKRALFFSKLIGRRRIYRQHIDSPVKGMQLFEYKRECNAQNICDQINKAYNDNFKVERKAD